MRLAKTNPRKFLSLRSPLKLPDRASGKKPDSLRYALIFYALVRWLPSQQKSSSLPIIRLQFGVHICPLSAMICYVDFSPHYERRG